MMVPVYAFVCIGICPQLYVHLTVLPSSNIYFESLTAAQGTRSRNKPTLGEEVWTGGTNSSEEECIFVLFPFLFYKTFVLFTFYKAECSGLSVIRLSWAEWAAEFVAADSVIQSYTSKYIEYRQILLKSICRIKFFILIFITK